MCCSDRANLQKETLEKQFEVVKERVSRNGTYMQGSHVLQFGSLSIDEEPVGDYLGEENTGQPDCHKFCCYTLHGYTAHLVVTLISMPRLKHCYNNCWSLLLKLCKGRPQDAASLWYLAHRAVLLLIFEWFNTILASVNMACSAATLPDPEEGCHEAACPTPPSSTVSAQATEPRMPVRILCMRTVSHKGMQSCCPCTLLLSRPAMGPRPSRPQLLCSKPWLPAPLLTRPSGTLYPRCCLYLRSPACYRSAVHVQ